MQCCYTSVAVMDVVQIDPIVEMTSLRTNSRNSRKNCLSSNVGSTRVPSEELCEGGVLVVTVLQKFVR
jgi:hypothetical protein